MRFLLLAGVIGLFSNCSNKEKDYIVELKTSKGNIKIYLYNETPKHKENFIRLVKDGFYDGLLFHRVIRDFMIQTGDPQSKNANHGEKLGSGDPGYSIPAEFNEKLFHEKGAVAAARQPDQINPEKASSGSQFYIVHGQKFPREALTINQDLLFSYFSMLLSKEGYEELRDEVMRLQVEQKYDSLNELAIRYKDTIETQLDVNVERNIPEEALKAYTETGGAPHLDGGYTVFGKVVEGLDVVDQIAIAPTRGEKPVEDIVIKKATAKLVSKSQIEQLYGISEQAN